VINIATTQDSFNISNTGDGSQLDENTIYNRFEKSNASEGMGLGLAIVKQICDSYQFRIEYSFQNGLHDFTIIYN
jgi:K+-sensing histidine kinase KdpD